MRITGFVIETPDAAAAQDAWRRLATTDRDVRFAPGEGGLVAVVLGVEDVTATERLLQRRGLVGDAGGFDVGGLEWRLAPFVPGEGDTTDLALDHVVVHSGDAERAAADHGARLGLDLRLDRRLEEHGFRGLFFRCGDAVVEIAAPTKGAAPLPLRLRPARPARPRRGPRGRPRGGSAAPWSARRSAGSSCRHPIAG